MKIVKCDNCGEKREIYPLMGLCRECTQRALDNDAEEAALRAQYFRQGKIK